MPLTSLSAVSFDAPANTTPDFDPSVIQSSADSSTPVLQVKQNAAVTTRANGALYIYNNGVSNNWGATPSNWPGALVIENETATNSNTEGRAMIVLRTTDTFGGGVQDDEWTISLTPGGGKSLMFANPNQGNICMRMQPTGVIDIDGTIDTIAADVMYLGSGLCTQVNIAKSGALTKIKGDLEVQGDIDTETATTLTIGGTAATAVSIADTGVDTTVNGNAIFSSGLIEQRRTITVNADPGSSSPSASDTVWDGGLIIFTNSHGSETANTLTLPASIDNCGSNKVKYFSIINASTNNAALTVSTVSGPGSGSIAVGDMGRFACVNDGGTTTYHHLN